MMKSSSKSLESAKNAGTEKAQKAFKDEFIESIDYDFDLNEVITYKSVMTDDIAIDTVMRTTFYESMKAMSDAAEKATSTELARSLGYVALKKSMSQMLWKYTIKNGGLISIHTSILGYELDYNSDPSRQFADKWWTNQNWFNQQLWTASDFGLTTTEDSDYWEEAYVEDDGTDNDDYWYSETSDDATTTTTTTTSDSDDEDDYWYGDDNSASAAE
jgi:hypothetical protein